MAPDNKTLGRFILDGIPPAHRGIPQIEVMFDIDANGILSVKAKDKGTGKEQFVRIEASSGLSKEDIERMKRDAEAHAEEDKRKRELAEVKNIADTMIYTTDKALREAGEKVPQGIRDDINKKKTDLEDALKKDDVSGIRNASQIYSEAAQKIGEYLYKQGTEGSSGTQGPRDVEHEDIKDDNKDDGTKS